MKAGELRQMRLEAFSKGLTAEMKDKLSDMNLSPAHAHYIMHDMLSDLEIDDEKDMGVMAEVVDKIIVDYTEELMLKEFNRYELDWE